MLYDGGRRKMYLLVAINRALMSQSRQKGFYYYVSHDYLGVIDSYKGKGVASLLFQTFLEICRKEKYDFIVSDTNPKSVSSVTYHLRMGFKKFAMNYCKQSRSISFYIPLEK